MQYMHIWTHLSDSCWSIITLELHIFGRSQPSAVQIFYAGDQLHGDHTFHANHVFHMLQICVMDHV